MADDQVHDPLNFLRNMWGNMGFGLPGMVAPTFDLDELDKRIKDMKAVEGWLRMNLSMLQMTIQGLEMQRSTVSTVQTMGRMATDAARAATQPTEAEAEEVDSTVNPEKGAFSEVAMWPWQIMQQVREQMQKSAEAAPEEAATSEAPAKKPPPKRRPAAKKPSGSR